MSRGSLAELREVILEVGGVELMCCVISNIAQHALRQGSCEGEESVSVSLCIVFIICPQSSSTKGLRIDVIQTFNYCRNKIHHKTFQSITLSLYVIGTNKEETRVDKTGAIV